MRRPSASATSWWPRQMPKSGTWPSSSRTVSTGPVSCAGSPGPFPIRTAAGSCASTSSAEAEPGTTTAWTPGLRRAAGRSSACSRGRARRRAGRRRPSTSRACTPRARVAARRGAGSASIRSQSRWGWASARSCSSSGGAVPSAQRIAPSSRSRRTSARVSTSSSATIALRREPGRPRRPGAAHHDALRPDPLGLEQALVDAVVADERRGEGEHLARIARVGDGLLVAGRSGREAGLARGDAGGADGAAGEDGAVFEDECGAGHGSHTTQRVCIIRRCSPRRSSVRPATPARRRSTACSRTRSSSSSRSAPTRSRDSRQRRSIRGSSADVPDFVPNDEALAAGAELVFCCLDHERAAALEPPAGAVVVDLTRRAPARRSALYPEWYGFEHPHAGRRSARGRTGSPSSSRRKGR